MEVVNWRVFGRSLVRTSRILEVVNWRVFGRSLVRTCCTLDMSKRHRLDIGDSSSKKPKEDDGGGLEGTPTEQDMINIKKVRTRTTRNVSLS